MCILICKYIYVSICTHVADIFVYTHTFTYTPLTCNNMSILPRLQIVFASLSRSHSLSRARERESERESERERERGMLHILNLNIYTECTCSNFSSSRSQIFTAPEKETDMHHPHTKPTKHHTLNPRTLLQ